MRGTEGTGTGVPGAVHLYLSPLYHRRRYHIFHGLSTLNVEGLLLIFPLLNS